MSQTNNNDRISRRRIDCWETRWEGFLREHHAWWQRRSAAGEPVYCLSHHVLNELAGVDPLLGPNRQCRSRFLAEEDESSERAFTRLCERPFEASGPARWDSNVVGVFPWGRVIPYPLLANEVSAWRPGRQRTGNAATKSGWEQGRQTRLAVAQTQMVHIAWLVQQAEYWRELNAVRSQWLAIRNYVGYSGINGRLVPIAEWAMEAAESTEMSKGESGFRLVLASFAQRWGLSGLLTWDLPVPALPLTSLPAEILRSHRLQTAFNCAIPVFLPKSRLWGDQRVVWELPSPDPRRALIDHGPRNGRSMCLQNEVPTYSLVLQAYMTEVAVRNRFGEGLPHGVTGRMECGLAAEAGKDSGHVRRARGRLSHAF